MPTIELLQQVEQIAAQAGELIMQVYQQDFDVEHKDDNSPLTQADLLSHRCIIEALQQLTPNIPIISEESAVVPVEQRKQWSSLWLVDPLDGTREFIKKNGEFTVNIALIENGAPVLGVISAPAQQRCWAATVSVGAFEVVGAKRSFIEVAKSKSSLRVAASRSHLDEKTVSALQRMGDVQRVSVGSALKFCLLANGEIDVYPRFAPTWEWDTAAGQCIVEMAGGVVLNLDGSRKTYNQRDTLLNEHFMALADVTLNWREWL
jgi:3'(2'), 5'-bisphosphate nucleotidase